MKGLSKFLIEAIPGIEDIKDKEIDRERSACPECESIVIVYKSRTRDYVCEKCFARFKYPKKITQVRDDGICIHTKTGNKGKGKSKWFRKWDK